MQKDFILPIQRLSKKVSCPKSGKFLIANCGTVCVKMCLNFFNSTTLSDYDFVEKEILLNDIQISLEKISNRNGIKTIVWDIRKHEKHYDFLSSNVKNTNWILNEIFKNLRMGFPSMVLLKRKDENQFGTHTVLIIGASIDSKGEIVGFHFNNPENDNKGGSPEYLELKHFLELWKRFVVIMIK